MTHRLRKIKRRIYELRKKRKLSKKRKRKRVQCSHSSYNNFNLLNKRKYQLIAPRDFRLLKNTEECVKFFKKVRNREKAFVNKYGFKELHIDLSGIIHIDFAATMMLDSICDELAKTEPICNIFGNTPNRKACEQYLKDSGFLNNKVDAQGRLFDNVGSNENMKIERGQVKLEDANIQKVVDIEKRICKHVTGCEGRLYKHIDMIKEICGNTVEWSEAEHNQWSYGVKFEEDKVIVVALDLGKGILETISRKFPDILADWIKSHSHIDILKGAFNKKYGSKSRRRNRNKGLPSLKYANEIGVIRDLTVITNNVVLDFSSENECRKYHWHKGRALNGTLYSWVIDRNCYKK